MPAGLEVMEIGDDYLVALPRDELGVERVEIYGVIKSRGSRRPGTPASRPTP